MKNFSQSDLKSLLKYTAENCISIYISTPEIGAQGHMQPAYLHTAITKGIKKANITEKKDVERIEKVFNEIANADEFREERAKSFVIFIGPDSYWWYRLPIQVKSDLVVSRFFYLVPLLQLLHWDFPFYVLSLNANKIEFFEGNRTNLEKINVPNLPESREAVVGVQADDRMLQRHSSVLGSAGGDRSATFHGSSWKDDLHKYTDKFLEAVNSAIVKYMENERRGVPLVVVGVERMITEFEKVTTIPNFNRELVLEGNFQRDSQTEFHQKVLSVLRPYILDQMFAQATQYMEHGSDERFSTDLPEILKQARMGRVKTLFVVSNQHVWGNFDINSLEVTVDQNSTGINKDLLDVACRETVINNGEVFILPREKMPNNAMIIAVFRY